MGTGMGDGGEGSGRSGRTERVLDPTFVDGLDELPLDELRDRRDLATRERDFQSYLRRLLQTPYDLLVAERTRRAEGTDPAPIVERLKAVLSDSPRGVSRGEAIRVTLSAEDVEEARASAGALVSASKVAAPEGLSDQELGDAIAALEEEERRVSAVRHAVFQVHDRLQEALKRRYLEDPGLIPTPLS